MQVGLDMLNIPFGFIAIILGISLFLVATALEKNAYRVLAAPAILISVCWMHAGLLNIGAVAVEFLHHPLGHGGPDCVMVATEQDGLGKVLHHAAHPPK